MGLHPDSAIATRSVTTRRTQFDFDNRVTRRHFAQGDLLTSHLVALMSAMIPEGERFVVDERDHTELLERWRAEAFGPDSIVEKRSRRAAA